MMMEFILDGSPDCPLIRLSDTSAQDIAALLGAWTFLSRKIGVVISLAALPGMNAKEGCDLICKSAEESVGFQRQTGNRFACVLTRAAWEDVRGLTEPFLSPQAGYQWLIEEDEVSLLLSPSGRW